MSVNRHLVKQLVTPYTGILGHHCGKAVMTWNDIQDIESNGLLTNQNA
jgi:hypothetical protein